MAKLAVILAVVLMAGGKDWAIIPEELGDVGDSKTWTVHCRETPDKDGLWWVRPSPEAAQQYCDFWRRLKAHREQTKPRKEQRECPANVLCS